MGDVVQHEIEASPSRSDDPILELPSGKKVRQGDWVLIQVQVADQRFNHDGVADARPHPEDILLTCFSHNEHYKIHVRKDRVADKTQAPEDWPSCPHLIKKIGFAGLYLCERDDHHSGLHLAHIPDPDAGAGPSALFPHEWTDAQSIGFFEENP